MKFIKFVSVFVGLSLLVQSVTPANASTVAPSYAAEDYIAARLQAAVTNHRILVISEMSELSTTWVNPDGTLTTESFGAPVRVRDGAGEYGWRDLDFTLVFDDAGFVRAKSGRFDFKVSGGGIKAGLQSYVNSKTFDKWLGKSVDVSLKQISKLPIIKKLKIKEQKFALEFMKEALISKASDTATEPFWTSVWGTKPNVPKTSVNKLDLRCRPSK